MKKKFNKKIIIIPIVLLSVILIGFVIYSSLQSSFGGINTVNYVKPSTYQTYVYQNFSVADNIYSIGFLPNIGNEYHIHLTIEFWNYDNKSWDKIGGDYLHRDNYGGTNPFYNGDNHWYNEVENFGYVEAGYSWMNESDMTMHDVFACRDDITPADIQYGENPICVYKGTAKVENPSYSGNIITVPYTDRQNYSPFSTVGYYPTLWTADSKYMRNGDVLSRLKYSSSDSWSAYGGVFLKQYKSTTGTVYYIYDDNNNECYSQALLSAPSGTWETSMSACETHLKYQDYYFVNGDNVCESINLLQGTNSVNQYNTTDECEANRVSQTLYLLKDNECSEEQVFVGEETSNDYSTLEECQSNIKNEKSVITGYQVEVNQGSKTGFISRSLKSSGNFFSRSLQSSSNFFSNIWNWIIGLF